MSNEFEFNPLPGDELIFSKKELPFINHHALYLGYDTDGVDWVIENRPYEGIALTTLNEILSESLPIKRLQRFRGSSLERNQLITKSLASLGGPYNLFDYNCEHFTSHMLTGNAKSKQIETFKDAIQVALGILALYILTNLFSNN